MKIPLNIKPLALDENVRNNHIRISIFPMHTNELTVLEFYGVTHEIKKSTEM